MASSKSLRTLSLVLLLVSATAAQDQKILKLSSTVQASVPPNWQVGNQAANSVQLFVPLQKGRKFAGVPGDKENPKPELVVASEASLLITIEQRKDHADALRRLAAIAAEYPEPPTTLLIAGWPAIERRYRALMPQPGEGEGAGGNVTTSFSTTAIAQGITVIRFDAMLAPDADPKLLDQAQQIAKSMRAPQGPAATSERELKQILQMAKPPTGTQKSGDNGNKTGGGHNQPGVAVQVQTGLGELEVASNDGQHVVVAANSGFSFSDNFGASYTFGGGTPCNQTVCDGDPSLAVGNSGDIYYAWIGGTSSAALSDGVSRSTNNGHSFSFRGLSATCPGTTGCSVADQEHIAADRNNAATGGGDRVYAVWRDFAPTFSIRISCSSDGGATWTSGSAIGAGDLPRVSVGGDGFVYAAWASGGNMMLHKFSNCDAGLSPQAGWPVTVASFTDVACPVPGLDRCNGRNILSSQKVAVDDLDSNHIYYAFATSTGAGNEDVMVFDSTDGGATFPRSVRVNNGVAGRRFMPWISTYGGIAVVSWYDRRNATLANNDLTRYFIGGAAVKGPNLVALSETDLSGNNDTQCSTWPCATNAKTDSESCSIQPELGGRCATGGVLSGTACDFSTPTACSSGQTCSIGRGCPKYGDYNGNAAGGGRMYSAWSSATPPASVGGSAGSIRVYASADRIPSDFYVRDWNDSSASFDNGAQPSTHSNFWSTSDVWNQNVTAPEAPSGNGSVIGDPPSRTGLNFAFAQVSRRAAAMSTAPDANVTVNFFYGDYGLGAPFVSVGSEVVTLHAADMTQLTPAHAWAVPAGASSHLCLAVQITGPDGDDFALPSISGIAPGPADPLIIADNNKAQRNLQDTIGTASGTEMIAIIANSERVRRNIQLRVSVPKGVRIPGTVEVIGGQRITIGNDGVLSVGTLAPGEYRFVRLSVNSLADVDKPVPISIFEATNPPANGFTVLVHRDSAEKVQRRTLVEFADVMLRLSELENIASAKKQSEIALKAAKEERGGEYLAYLATSRSAIDQVVVEHLRLAKGPDAFGIAQAQKALWSAVAEKNSDAALAALNALSERLDAHMTALYHQKNRP